MINGRVSLWSVSLSFKPWELKRLRCGRSCKLNQPVPTAADLKAPRLPEWLSGQVRTYTVLDGGCHMLEVFRMIKESWIFLAESFISQNKTKTNLNDSLCRYLFAEMFTTCFCSKCVQAFYLILIFWFNARQVCSIFFILKKLCSC